jgi:hypothetical protein
MTKTKSSDDRDYSTKDRDEITLLLVHRFVHKNVVNTSEPGQQVIMEWTFGPEVRDLVDLYTKKGAEAIKLDGFTWYDYQRAQNIFKRNLHIITHDTHDD